MSCKATEILSKIGVILFFILFIVLAIFCCMTIKMAIMEARQPNIYYIDTTQVNVDVIYRNTWGKIIIVREIENENKSSTS